MLVRMVLTLWQGLHLSCSRSRQMLPSLRSTHALRLWATAPTARVASAQSARVNVGVPQLRDKADLGRQGGVVAREGQAQGEDAALPGRLVRPKDGGCSHTAPQLSGCTPGACGRRGAAPGAPFQRNRELSKAGLALQPSGGDWDICFRSEASRSCADADSLPEPMAAPPCTQPAEPRGADGPCRTPGENCCPAGSARAAACDLG